MANFQQEFQQSDGAATFLHLQANVSQPSLTLRNRHAAVSQLVSGDMRRKFGKFFSKKSGSWYWQDNHSRKTSKLGQGTLGTRDQVEAERVLADQCYVW